MDVAEGNRWNRVRRQRTYATVPTDVAQRAWRANSADDGFAAVPKGCFGRQPAAVRVDRPVSDTVSVADGVRFGMLVGHRQLVTVAVLDDTAGGVGRATVW